MYFYLISNISNHVHIIRISYHLLLANILFAQGFLKVFQIQLFKIFIHHISPIVFNIKFIALLKIQPTTMNFLFQVIRFSRLINHMYTLFKDQERISIWNQTFSAHLFLKLQRYFFAFQCPRLYFIKSI